MLLKHIPYLLVYNMRVQQVSYTTDDLNIHLEEAESNASGEQHETARSTTDSPHHSPASESPTLHGPAVHE